MKFQLGQAVRVQAVIQVQKTWDGGCITRKLVSQPQQHAGIVIGMRTMAEGWNDGGWNEDDPICFVATRYCRVVLVAVSMRQMVRAFPEDVLSEEREA